MKDLSFFSFYFVGKKLKHARESRKNLIYCAKIVKFGLILTHLKLFWSKLGGKKIFDGKMPPCGAATTFHSFIYYHQTTHKRLYCLSVFHDFLHHMYMSQY